MAITNYGELKAIVKKYTHRTDLDDDIPGFVSLAISKLNRDCKSIYMEKNLTEDITYTVPIDLPTDYREIRRIMVAGIPLMQWSPRQRALASKNWTESGITDRYAIVNRKIELQPAPQEEVEISIDYLGRIEEFVEDSDTHLLLTYNPNIFIYAAMREAMPFLEHDARTPLWSDLLKGELLGENGSSAEEMWSGAPLSIQPEGMTP